ncbi:MAG: alginate export family protein [Armatimonadetes bacterium]|nr:alginate export family protein [Armatimonadota bacterium]
MIFIPALPLKPETNQLKFKTTIEYRARYERRTDGDFNAAANDNKSYLYQRVRPSLSWKYGKTWSGILQYQYAHQLQWAQSGNNSTDNSDLFQGYVTKTDGDKKVTVGRQRISFGSTRLIGSPDWGNTGKSYDAVRYQSKTLDVVVARYGAVQKASSSARYAAVGMENKLGTTALIYKHDTATGGRIDHYTLDHVYESNLGKAKAEAEGAYQVGRNAGKDQNAWAVHLKLSNKFGKKDSGYFEINSASGGSTATTNRGFDVLTPSTHGVYGLMDVQGWKNMNQIAIGFKHDINKSVDLSFRGASNDLRVVSDGWYGTSGSLNKSGSTSLIDATGSSGRHVGEEYDLEFNFKTKHKDSISAGLAMFAPGTFIKNVAGSSRNQYWGYVQYSTKF